MNPKSVGILSLQGCVEQHAHYLRELGAQPRFVYQKDDLAGLHGLILPGGESTVMLKLAHELGMWDALKALARDIPYWGICAGSILMATHVENPEQPCLGVMDLRVRRNAYGRQRESFEGSVCIEPDPPPSPDEGTQQREEPAVFIRAPQFVSWGPNVRIAGRVQGKAVYLDDGQHCVTAFHPELTSSGWFHERFLKRLR